jgi:hypothetical protein
MARSNNNNKLKAFVRFDGSGRIISSSLIVQAFKPKVGNWKEIDAKECCNYVAPTTTSTTTIAPTTTSTTTAAPTTTTSTTVAPTTTTTTTENLECLSFEIQVVTSSEITMVDCDGLVIPFTITGPVTETYCARSISGTGDVTITELGPCA